MGRGVVSGLVWGVLVSVVVLAAVSLSTPLPDRAAPPPATAADPATPDALGAPPESPPAAQPTAPQADQVAPEALGAPPEAQPAPTAALPEGDQAPAPQPPQSAEASAPAAEAAPEAQATAAAPAPSIAESPARPAPEALPDAAAPALAVAADPAAVGTPPSRAEAPAGEGQPGAGELDTTPPPPAPMPAPALDPVDVPEAGSRPPLPQVAPPEAASAAVDLLAPSDAAPPPEVEAAPQPEAMTETMTEVEAEDTRPAGALAANAVPFEADADQPLMAVVLIDDPASPLDLGILSQISFPVSFAIDPQSPDAGARAATLREAGFEVLIFGAGAIPPRAVAADVEVALEAARRTLPQAVALIDNPASRIQGDRPVLEATVAALGASGHGLVAFPGGLNAAETAAQRMGLPVGTAFRLLDDEDQRAPVITRYLDRAAFAAAQEGAVIVVGRTRPDTVTALFSWALGGRAEGVGLAPISAVLRRLTP